MSNTNCKDCNAPLGRSVSVWSFWNPNDYPCANNTSNHNNTNSDNNNEKTACQGRLCSTCYGKHPLIQTAEGSDDPTKGTIVHYCKSCFQNQSTIDFTRTFDVVRGDTTKEGNNIVWIFVHGASASKQMFRAHAEELKKRFGHSSILVDLPGHASLIDTPLTLESCVTTLETVLKECESWTKGQKLIYVGGSLGAYVGFYVVDKLQDRFVGAVLMDCGQNVGPGASYKARAGLVVLKWIGRHCSNATLMQLMLGETKKSQADYHLMDTVFGAGMFFDQADAHVECLRAVAPADYIPTIPFPILFMNGSEDYRDSETKWLDLCRNKDVSELKVYEGGDHFFMHDTRFVEDIFNRWETFAKKL